MSKIADKISLTEDKLEEIRAKFEADKTDLASLTRQRAKLEAEAVLEDKQNGKRVTEIDTQRKALRSQLEIYPDLIREVEAKIEALKKEKVEGILRENLAKQKKAAREIERLSEDLGALLGKANDTNVELQKHRSRYLELHKLTDQDVITKPTTLGSHGWLKTLTAVIKSELEGKPRPSPRYLGGPAPPI